MLALSGLVVGVAPWVLNAPLSAAAAAILKHAHRHVAGAWHGLSPALMLSGLTLLGVAVAYTGRDRIRHLAWRPARGTEALYTGALSALDAVSRVIGPPLHSASLRSYVHGDRGHDGGRWRGGARHRPWRRPRPTRKTSVRLHEVLVVVVIVAGSDRGRARQDHHGAPCCRSAWSATAWR